MGCAKNCINKIANPKKHILSRPNMCPTATICCGLCMCSLKCSETGICLANCCNKEHPCIYHAYWTLAWLASSGVSRSHAWCEKKRICIHTHALICCKKATDAAGDQVDIPCVPAVVHICAPGCCVDRITDRSTDWMAASTICEAACCISTSFSRLACSAVC